MTDPLSSRRRFLRIAGAGLTAGLAGCFASSADAPSAATSSEPSPTAESTRSPDTTTPTEAEGSSTEGARATNTDTVAMVTDNEGSYFDPKGLLVEPGATVAFVNESGDHSATAYHPSNGDQPLRIPEDAEPWDSGLYTEPDRTFEVTLEVEGVYDYYCTPHEMMGMVGRIVVGEPQGGPGTTAPEALPPAARDALPSVATVIEDGSVPGP